MSGRREERPTRSLAESLARLAGELGLGEVHASSAVFDRWDDLVGADVAAHAHPVKLRDGVLTVEADDPGWGSQLRYLGSDLVARINASLGGESVREIRVVVGRPGRGDSGRPPRRG